MREALIGLLEPEIEGLGLELVEVEFAAHRGGGLLRLYIDRAGATAEAGVTVEDCERASRHVSQFLDVHEPIRGAYTLEVSSPGFDRPLRLPRHYAAACGERMKVELSVPCNGRRRYTGVLESFDGGRLRLNVDGEAVELPLADVHKARLAPL